MSFGADINSFVPFPAEGTVGDARGENNSTATGVRRPQAGRSSYEGSGIAELQGEGGVLEIRGQ